MCARIAAIFALVSILIGTTGPARAAPVRGGKEDKEIPKLIKQLGAEDEATRKQAAKRLTEIGLPARLALHEVAEGNNAPLKKEAEQIITAIGEKGKKRVTERLNKLDANAAAMLRPIANVSLARLFPEYQFYAVVFRQYPIARQPPEPLKMQNIFIVDKKGTLKQVTSNKELHNFFRSALRPVKAEGTMKDVTRAWLSLGPEFHQDGFYSFSVPKKDDVTVAEEGKTKQATGKSVVAPKGGNGGEVQITLTFDAAGKLTQFTEKAKLRQGIRPICQATKLLDADPIVRRMAEKDILVMGRAAKSYLDEQRAKARPELQKAIDRVWKRIIAEGW